MKIGIDIMGGDYSPEKTVHGAILATNELPNNISLVFFGQKEKIMSELKKHNVSETQFEIVDCKEIISMEDHPTKAFRLKTQSSISKGFEYLAHGKIDGLASAGNTGAMFIGAFYAIKTIPGILRPPLVALIPKENGGLKVLLDVGANADCKPDVLYQFGVLGSLFSKYVCNVETPRVSLLNLGEEKTKGNLLTQAAHMLMEDNPDYNFIGNCEGRDLFSPSNDVIVCDGFTGNIVIKQAEGFYSLMKKRGVLDSFFSQLNYESYGGTPILGLNKTVVIGHGISNEIAIKNMILLTKNVVEADLTKKINHNIN